MEAGRSDGGSSGSMGVPCGRAWQKKGAGARCHGDSNNSAAISRKRIHGAATMRTNSSNTEKTHTFGNMQFARRHRSQGWAGPLFGCPGKEVPIG
jgi:hypothetical protein